MRRLWHTLLLAALLAAWAAGPLTLAPAAAQTDPPPYLDPARAIDERLEDLLGRMTLDEKIGQMTQVESGSIHPEDIAPLGIGSILSGGNGDPHLGNQPGHWAVMVNFFQTLALESRLKIPLIYGIDAVHGHNNVQGAVIFPHNIGLGAAHDPDLVERIGQFTAAEMAATGIWWTFAPVVAVPQDIRWGRTYEGFSEDTALVAELGAASVRGLQGTDLSAPFTVAATAKHYVGDGGTAWDSSTMLGARLDRGDTRVDEATLRAIHLPPYVAAVEAGARVVMASFSRWDQLNMHAQTYLLTDVLKGELGFSGFVVSDWAGINYVALSYYDAVVIATNAGIDMTMVPYDYPRFITALTHAVEQGDVSEARIDDAVRRILRVKFELGLFERPLSDPAWLADVGSAEHRALGREAVAKSLVLLKNEGSALPLAETTPTVLIAGSAANDIGMQCGGWSITWQGMPGQITDGTTVLDGIAAALDPAMRFTYDPVALFPQLPAETRAAVGIAVVGETPYAEWFGDSPAPALSQADQGAVAALRARVDTLILVIISGRPVLITEQVELADAVVAAWLPGTEGDGVADGLFGRTPFTGTLPYTWPRTAEQFPQTAIPAGQEPLYPLGYGLTKR